MSRVVKRTYFKDYVLVDKRGRVIQKNIDRMKDAIQSGDYSEAQKMTMIADLHAYVRQSKYERKKLTTSGFMGYLAEDKVSRFLVNAGYSVEEFSEETGVSEKDIMNLDNWKDEKLKVKDRTIAFQWNYNGLFWREE